MSKMDGLRAMREARYERTVARAKTAPTTARPRVAPPASGPVAGPVAVPVAGPGKAGAAAAPAVEELCGHRNMGGRTCTREQGHAAKSHRYS